MSLDATRLRVLLLPLVPPPDPWDLLLPQSAVAEVVPLQAPEPRGAEAPDWLCGYLRWRGLRLPLVRPVPAAAPPGEVGPRACAVVCLAPSGTVKAPFFAIESPGMPRLEWITPQVLSPDTAGPAQARGPFILAALRLRERPAGLLDLDALERALAELAEAVR